MENNMKDQDVLLVKEKGKDDLQVASMDEKGNVKRVKPKEGVNPDFMKIDQNGTMLENFYENFKRQVQNTAQFEFFRVSAEKFNEVMQKLQDAFKNPNKPENKDFIDMHRVEPNDFLKKEQQSQQSPKIDPNLINWEKFEQYGITRETLEKTKEIDKLLDYRKTGLMNVTIKLDDETQALRTDGRFSLRKQEDGTFSPAVHLIRHKPELDRPYFGVQFTEEDKRNLLTTGNLGRIVDAEFRQGEKTPIYLSLDKLTNELAAYRKEWVKVPDTYKGVQLNDDQKQRLSEGKAVHFDNLISSQGKQFSADVQFNAEKKYFEMNFNNEKQNRQQSQKTEQSAAELSQNSKDVPKTFRKKELTEDQRDSLREGKTVYVDGLEDKKGKKYSGYITHNNETGRPDFIFPKDYKAALAAGKVIPDDRHKTQVAVNNEGKTNEATKDLKEPLKQGQTQPDEKQTEKQNEKKSEQNENQQQSQQSHKSKRPKIQ
jgi:hypothetical protein